MKVYKDNRGSHDLEVKIERLQIKIRELEEVNERLVEENSNFLKVNESHKKLNGELNTEIIFYKGKCSHYEKRAKELENDNKKLAMEVGDRVNQLRKAGLI